MQANLITKTDFDAKLLSLNRKIAVNESKHLLVENELKKLKTFDSSYFIGKSNFEEDGMQNYLIFQPIQRYFQVIAYTKYISEWKFKGLFDESIKPPSTSILFYISITFTLYMNLVLLVLLTMIQY